MVREPGETFQRLHLFGRGPLFAEDRKTDTEASWWRPAAGMTEPAGLHLARGLDSSLWSVGKGARRVNPGR